MREKMMYALLVAMIGVNACLAIDVVLEYIPPDLLLSIDVNVSSVQDVIFHFNVKHVQHQVHAVNVYNDTWEYKTKGIDLEGAVGVYAYAEIYSYKGSAFTTEHSFLSLEEKSLVTHIPGRSIRGAVYWRDDFNNFNGGDWGYEVSMYGGYNGEFQVYTNDGKNVYTRDGHLAIQPIATTSDPRFDENFLHTGRMDMATLFGYCTISDVNGCTRDGHNGILPPVMSGKVKSKPTMKYGIMEVRARIPKGDWIWPAIWFLPKNDHYGQWPRSGEIDVMESRGNNGDVGVGTVTSTLHWGPSADQNGFMKTHGEKHTGSWASDYHTWRLEWTPDHIQTFVDNQQIMSVDPGAGGFWRFGGFGGNNPWNGAGKMAPFDQDFYLMFNVAVGGTTGFFPDGINYGVRKPWANNSPKAAEDFWNAHNEWLPTWQGDQAALLIDYVQFSNL